MTIEVIMKNQQDATIGASYDLIATTLGELRTKLLDTQRKKDYPNLELEVFDTDSSLSHAIIFLKLNYPQFKEEFDAQLIIKSKEISSEMQQLVDEAKLKYKVKGKKNEIDYAFLLSTTVIDIEEDAQGNWYLLDGFRRTFVNKEFDEQPILIRKFNQFSTAKWVEYMLRANKWKRTVKLSFTALLDRGFMYAIYHRSGLAIPLFSENAFQSIDQLLSVAACYDIEDELDSAQRGYRDYTVDDVYAAYFGENDEFFHDLRFICDLDTVMPTERKLRLYQDKKKTEVKWHVKFDNGYKGMVFKMIVGTLAEVRKFESLKGIKRYQLNPETYMPILEVLMNEVKFVKSIEKLHELHATPYYKEKRKLALFVRQYLLTNLFNCDPEQITEEVPMVNQY